MGSKDTVERIWVRPKRGKKEIGCGNTKFYEILKSGRVKTKKIDGMRLIWLPSLHELGEEEAV